MIGYKHKTHTDSQPPPLSSSNNFVTQWTAMQADKTRERERKRDGKTAGKPPLTSQHTLRTLARKTQNASQLVEAKQ